MRNIWLLIATILFKVQLNNRICNYEFYKSEKDYIKMEIDAGNYNSLFDIYEGRRNLSGNILRSFDRPCLNLSRN